jgi:hypothetical protein
MNSDTKFVLLVMGLPIAGLIYCGIGIAVIANSEIIRQHALISGALFLLIPLTIGATIWLKASAKAYKKEN